MTETLDQGVTAPRGFEAAGVAAGLKSTGKADVAVVVNRGPRKIGAAGHHVLPLSEVALLGPDGAPVLAGERGEVIVRGHAVFAGYWNNPKATAERFERDVFAKGDLFYRTGDALRRDADGRHRRDGALGEHERGEHERRGAADQTRSCHEVP
mgnify:CR=1 FL=1